MLVRRVQRPSPLGPAAAARGAPAHPVLALQHRIGNRAVQRLLALQREATPEQKKEFAGFIAQGDWGRAAWVLNEWQPNDITARIRYMSAAELESLNEGAWQGGKGKVEAAVRALNPTAATMGALRVLIWGKRWDEAAKQLDNLDRKAAQKYVRDLADKGKITGDEQRLLMKITPKLGLQPGETMTVGKEIYTVYATTVRFGGDVVWRYNNPGALKRPSPDINAWGYIGNDPQWFLIFPDMTTGQKAAWANLQFQANAKGERSILETMQNYASMPSDRPDVYADKIVTALGGPPKYSRATKFGGLNEKELGIVKDTIFSTEAGTTGDEVPWDSSKLPQEVRDRLRK
jgi:hypothetical protein